MRKGRSTRKPRASLPPLGAKTKPTRADVSSEPGSGRSVTGVAEREDAPGTFARSELPDVTERRQLAGVGAAKRTLEMLAEPMLELVREAERETEHERTDAAVARAATAEPSQVATVKPMTDDEISIPPVGDLAVEPVADRFFSEGEVVAARASQEEHEQEWADVVARESRKSLPEVVERRARLSKYVRWAVGGAAVLCLAALGRTLVAPSTQASTQASSSLHAVNVLAAPLAAPVAPSVAPNVAPAPAARPAAEPAVTTAPPATPEPAAARTPEPAAEPAPAAVAVPVIDIPKAAPAEAPAAVDKASAREEKNASRRALERGKVTDAIAAGERSVALDPTDGEAWLLLGAAYQDKGNLGEARRAYTACTKEGTRGPIGECRAMLR